MCKQPENDRQIYVSLFIVKYIWNIMSKFNKDLMKSLSYVQYRYY